MSVFVCCSSDILGTSVLLGLGTLLNTLVSSSELFLPAWIQETDRAIQMTIQPTGSPLRVSDSEGESARWSLTKDEEREQFYSRTFSYRYTVFECFSSKVLLYLTT